MLLFLNRICIDENHLDTFTDHMLIVPWNSGSGWGAPTIKPYGPLTLDPSSVVFHVSKLYVRYIKPIH